MSIKTYLARVLTAVVLVLSSLTAKAQIGYQISLLNTATGEPRANVTVNAQVTITDSQGKTVCSETKRATSNDFGVLSLTVGKEDTFKNADSGALPFFIEVSVDGKLIGKSQILSVPMAEIAGKLKSSFTKEDLLGTWKWREEWRNDYGSSWDEQLYSFRQDNTGTYVSRGFNNTSSLFEHEFVYEFEYEIEGNTIYTYKIKGDNDYFVLHVLRWRNGGLYTNDITHNCFLKQ